MGLIQDLTDGFIPDDDPEHPTEDHRIRVSRWRRRVAMVACSNWLFTFPILVPVLVTLLFVGVPMIGKVAWSNEVGQLMDAKISKNNEPIFQQLSELKKVQRSQGEILLELATRSIRADICRYVARRATETDQGERTRLYDQITELRTKYKQYSGEEFNPTDC